MDREWRSKRGVASDNLQLAPPNSPCRFDISETYVSIWIQHKELICIHYSHLHGKDLIRLPENRSKSAQESIRIWEQWKPKLINHLEWVEQTELGDYSDELDRAGIDGTLHLPESAHPVSLKRTKAQALDVSIRAYRTSGAPTDLQKLTDDSASIKPTYLLKLAATESEFFFYVRVNAVELAEYIKERITIKEGVCTSKSRDVKVIRLGQQYLAAVRLETLEKAGIEHTLIKE